MRISDWSADVCSSGLIGQGGREWDLDDVAWPSALCIQASRSLDALDFPGECVEKRHARHACGPAAGLDLERDIAKVLAAIGMMVTEWWCRLDRRFEIIAIESGDLLDVVQARVVARLQARGRTAARVERPLPGVLYTRPKGFVLKTIELFIGHRAD